MKILFILCLIVFLSLSACSQNTEKQLLESREATQQLGSQLKNKLKNSLQSGGPIEALTICNIEAKNIAGRVSNELDLKVRRTSLKLRNTANASDDWENEVLHYFEQQKKSGVDITELEIYEITKDISGKWFRYMKAIPTVEVCLVCHGESIAEPIKKKLQALYPNDQAIDFKVGDIRGAFTVKIKM